MTSQRWTSKRRSAASSRVEFAHSQFGFDGCVWGDTCGDVPALEGLWKVYALQAVEPEHYTGVFPSIAKVLAEGQPCSMLVESYGWAPCLLLGRGHGGCEHVCPTGIFLSSVWSGPNRGLSTNRQNSPSGQASQGIHA